MLFLLIAAGSAALVYGIYRFEHRKIVSAGDLVSLLPGDEASVLFADVALLRRVGVLNLLASSTSVEDIDYRSFVQATQFDYTKDVDALAAAIRTNEVFFVIRGRFDWTRLRDYAISKGGVCDGKLCRAPTSKPNRWASFARVQSDVMALAVSSDRTAAAIFSVKRGPSVEQAASGPVWLSIAPSVFRNPASLPQALQYFAFPLVQAERVVLSIGGSVAAWTLQMDARCSSPTSARVLRDRLTERTRLLKRTFARAHEEPNPSDLTGMVAEGTFQQQGLRVVGNWPLHAELLTALQ